MADRPLRTRIIRALGGGALIAVLAGGTALAADQSVAISGFSYSPASVTVNVGDTVTWTNSGAQAHTATADDGSWDTGNIAGSGTDAVTFATAGTFPYHCDIHPQMTGTVTVQAAAATTAPVGGAGATTPPTDTAPGGTDRGSPGGLLAPLVIVVAWAVAMVAVLRRLVRIR